MAPAPVPDARLSDAAASAEVTVANVAPLLFRAETAMLVAVVADPVLLERVNTLAFMSVEMLSKSVEPLFPISKCPVAPPSLMDAVDPSLEVRCIVLAVPASTMSPALLPVELTIMLPPLKDNPPARLVRFTAPVVLASVM